VTDNGTGSGVFLQPTAVTIFSLERNHFRRKPNPFGFPATPTSFAAIEKNLTKGTCMVERHYRVLWLCLVCLSFVAVSCSPKEEKKKPVAPVAPSSLSALGMDIDSTDLSDTQQKLFEEIQNNAVTNESLISAFVEMHANAYAASRVATFDEILEAPTANAMESIIGNLASKASLDQPNQMELKKSLDQAIDSELGEILYNKAHVSFYSYFEKNRMQCFSGTSLFEVIRHMRASYAGDMAVIIFENGHVLPGYMERIGRENRFNLVGMETTVIGGRKFYGPADELTRGIRVIEASFFLATEIFESEIQNPQSVFNKALEITAGKYGLDLETIEQSIPRPVIRYAPDEDLQIQVADLQASFADRVNHSIFAFGDSSHVPSGDQQRREVEELRPSASGVNIAAGRWEFIERRPEGDAIDQNISNLYCGSPEGDSAINGRERTEFSLLLKPDLAEQLNQNNMLSNSQFYFFDVLGPEMVLGDSMGGLFSIIDGQFSLIREGAESAYPVPDGLACQVLMVFGNESFADSGLTQPVDNARLLNTYGFPRLMRFEDPEGNPEKSGVAVLFRPSGGSDAFVECSKPEADANISMCEIERALAPIGTLLAPSDVNGERQIFF